MIDEETGLGAGGVLDRDGSRFRERLASDQAAQPAFIFPGCPETYAKGCIRRRGSIAVGCWTCVVRYTPLSAQMYKQNSLNDMRIVL